MTQPTQAGRQDGPDHARLDKSLVHGIAWTAASKWGTAAVSWLSLLVIARLLSPEDFGLFALANLYLGLIRLVNELGLSSAIVRDRTLDEDQIARLGGLSVILGFGFSLLSAVFSIPVSLLLGDRAVANIIAMLSLTFIAAGLQTLPRSLLQRDLEFGKLAMVDVVEGLVTTVCTLVLAFLGFRYWALVLSSLMTSVVMTALTLALRPHRLAWPRKIKSIAAAVVFGWHVVVIRLSWYCYSNADFAVVGRVLGNASLGAYSFGLSIAAIPVDRIASLVFLVGTGIFAAVQDDHPTLRRYLLGLTEGLSFITFPASVGLAIVGDDLIHLALGPKWEAAILPLRLLAFYAGLRSVSTPLTDVLVAMGHSRKLMHYNLLALGVLPPLFYLGSHWGVAGVAAGWIVGYPLVMIPVLNAVFKAIEMPPLSYFRACWPAAVSSLLMGALVVAARGIMPATWPLSMRFGFEVALGAAAYALAVYAFHRPKFRSFVAILRRASA